MQNLVYTQNIVTAGQLEKIRLILSTYQDGSGQLARPQGKTLPVGVILSEPWRWPLRASRKKVKPFMMFWARSLRCLIHTMALHAKCVSYCGMFNGQGVPPSKSLTRPANFGMRCREKVWMISRLRQQGLAMSCCGWLNNGMRPLV